MKRMKFITPVAFCFCIFFAGCSKTDTNAASQCSDSSSPDAVVVRPSMKGWELYSWPACNDWYYAVLTGTNSLKSYNEVTGQTGTTAFVIKVFGKEKLKAVLHKLPAGESVFWAGEGWLQTTWGGNYSNLQLPPASIVTELQQYATQAGLNISVGY